MHGASEDALEQPGVSTLETSGLESSGFKDGAAKDTDLSVFDRATASVGLEVKNTLLLNLDGRKAAPENGRDTQCTRETILAEAAGVLSPWAFKSFATERGSLMEALSKRDQMEILRSFLQRTFLSITDVKNAFPRVAWDNELADYLLQPGTFWTVYLYPGEFGVLPVETFLKLLNLRGYETVYAVGRYGKLSEADQKVFQIELAKVDGSAILDRRAGKSSEAAAQ